MKECRYKFSGSYCANKKISGERCHGHDECVHYSPPFDASPLAMNVIMEDESREHHTCGVYSVKIQKFISDYQGDENQ